MNMYELSVEVAAGRRSFEKVWSARAAAGTWVQLFEDPSGLDEVDAAVLARFSLKELQVTAWLPLQARWVEEHAAVGNSYEEEDLVTDVVKQIAKEARSRLAG